MGGIKIMKHYKNAQNEIFAFELDGSQDHLITEEMILLSDSDLEILRQPTAEQLAAAEKAKALAELSAIDLGSIRALREYVAAQPNAPQYIKDKEAAAQTARNKLK
jgi:hypothetical protein